MVAANRKEIWKYGLYLKSNILWPRKTMEVDIRGWGP